MATAYHNLSEYDFNSVPNAEGMKFGIVVSEWNFNITGALLKGAVISKQSSVIYGWINQSFKNTQDIVIQDEWQLFS